MCFSVVSQGVRREWRERERKERKEGDARRARENIKRKEGDAGREGERERK